MFHHIGTCVTQVRPVYPQIKGLILLCNIIAGPLRIIGKGEYIWGSGLVDKLGVLDTALDVVKEQLDIPEDEDVQIVEYPEMENPMDQFLKRIRQSIVKTELPDELLRLQAQLEELARLQHETYFAWFPYRVIVE